MNPEKILRLKVGDKVRINAPGVYGNDKEGVVTQLNPASKYPYKVEFPVYDEGVGIKDDCDYQDSEVELLDLVTPGLAGASIEELEAELVRRRQEAREASRFQNRLRALPVGAIFLSPYTEEPMIKINEDEIRFELKFNTPRTVLITSTANDPVAPLVVVYPLADSE